MILELLAVVLCFTAFSLVHSILAHNKIKSICAAKYPLFMPYYRVSYNIISFVSFYYLFDLAPKPNFKLYDLKYPYDILILVPQFLSIIGIIWSLKYFDASEFLGISQIRRAKKGEYHNQTLDEESVLRVEGPYKVSRHPLYLFIILYLLFRPVMTVFYFTFFVTVVLYFYIGSIYEEIKLVERFGNSYTEYQKKVRRIF